MPSKSFESLAEEILIHRWKSSPSAATYEGIHDYDHEMDSLDRDYLSSMYKKEKEYLRLLRSFPTQELDAAQRLDHEILINLLDSRIVDFEQIRYWEKDPGIYPTIALHSVWILTFRDFAPLEERAHSVLSRLNSIPRLLAEGKVNLKDSPRVFTEVAISVVERGIKFFSEFIPALAEKTAMETHLLKANEKAISAFSDYLRFLREEHLPRSCGEFAIGRSLFELKLKLQHGLPYKADDLVEIGTEALEETQMELNSVARQVGQGSSWKEMISELKTHHPRAEDLIKSYQKEMERARQFTIEKGLIDFPPEEELEIIPTPIFERPLIPYAAIIPPAPFERKQKSFFYVTTVEEGIPAEEREERLKGHCLYTIPVTALHEAYPGHHLQITIANGIPSRVRKIYETPVLCEGWAFYCEEMMYEQGFYADPKVRLFQLKDQLWRACRVLIDVGLHTGQMKYEEAVDLLLEKAMLEKPNAISEINRYCATPTQPMSYLIGKKEIIKLRDECRERLGSLFELREFHNKLLSYGNIPIGLIKKAMKNRGELLE